MLYSPNVSAITKWSQTDENKKWLVFTYIKPIYKLNINELIQNLTKQSKVFHQPLHILCHR